MDSHLIPWLQWFQILVPAAIALVALIVTAWIQFGQSRTTRTKLKFDLFNERYEVFKVIHEINLAATEARGDNWTGIYISKMNDATDKMHRFRLLFPAHIGAQVDEIINCWHAFSTLKAEGEGMRKPSEEWSKNVRTRREVWEKIDARNSILRRQIEDFIRVDWNG